MNAIETAEPRELKRQEPPRVRGKLREAIEIAITEGLDWPEAATRGGLTTRAMRKALNRPHVLRFIRERRALFRAEISTKNEHRLAAIRDQDDNKMASVHAIKVIEQLERDEGERPNLNRNVTPGVVVVINNNRGAPAVNYDEIIEINPVAVEAHHANQ